MLEDTEKSYHAKHRVTENDIFDNRLIFGDNLLALKALEQEFAGKVKCFFIDPPYNTGSAFEHYDDGVEHSIWLSLMRDRLEIIRSLMAENGSLWITIDDNEAHYLKVLCDEVFGRKNFVANAIWQKKYSIQSDAKWLSDSHDHIFCFAKNKDVWRPNLLPRTEKQNKLYKHDDNDGRGLWRTDNVLVKTFSKSGVFPIVNPNTGEKHWPPEGSCYRFNEETANRLVDENRLYFGKGGKGRPQLKRYLLEVKQGITSNTLWLREEVGDNQDAKNEIKTLFSGDIFATPKPEKLLQRILFLASNPGDLVVDSFAGSGTTGAVAHKMGRRWIMVELGEHCDTHIIPRLQRVVNGEDNGGISKSVNWKGGGGFRYYRIAPSLLEKDKWGNWVISKEYNSAHLTEAVCKLEGFTYAPSDSIYWQHGYSTERDYIYVTTQNLNHSQLQQLNDEVGDNRSLLVLCSSFRGKANRYPNLTVKKIPRSVLSKCEWGHDDYSLNVENLPDAPPEPSPQTVVRKSRSPKAQQDLFEQGEGADE